MIDVVIAALLGIVVGSFGGIMVAALVSANGDDTDGGKR